MPAGGKEREIQPSRAYIVCSTQRSGSTYLCRLLASTGVAGIRRSTRRLAYWLEVFYQRNQTRIDGLARYFFAAAVALILQLVFWTLALAANIS